jgi:hypothetical protein
MVKPGSLSGPLTVVGNVSLLKLHHFCIARLHTNVVASGSPGTVGFRCCR